MNEIIRRRGRPSLDPGHKRSVTMTFRVTEATRDRLAEAAALRGCSISEEITRRIETVQMSEDVGDRVVAFIGSNLAVKIIDPQQSP